ncbi:folate-binding protein 1-like isoform X2 [Aristolochia californica]|uniref:folate-binding protein 1-like isoform X2 n=1 Tax=Aristolochia californica TaxID=171875 RepID=UPI0035E180A1
MHLVASASASGTSSELCISPGGRFPPFSSEGKSPRKVSKGPKDLTVCRVFRKRTCCDVAQTLPAFLSIRRLAFSGEANQECLHLWELLECAICDPRVGVQPGPPLICSSFCDVILQACLNAFFSVEAKHHVLSPCGFNDIVCGKAAEWASNGTELCHLAGFSVYVPEEHNEGAEKPFCYGGKSSLDSIANSWRGSESGSSFKTESSGLIEDFHQWVSEAPFTEKVTWAVGGMVLTAGLLFVSKRKRHSHRQKQAAILRTARRLEARVTKPSSATSQGNRKVNTR